MGLQRGIRRRMQDILALGASVILSVMAAPGPAAAADPIRVGLSLSLTGPTSPAGKQVLAGLEIWRDDVNAKGGLLGRPVQLVYYDDQGSPANAPGIYAKLMGVDKVELLIGPYSTNVIAASLPVAPPPASPRTAIPRRPAPAGRARGTSATPCEVPCERSGRPVTLATRLIPTSPEPQQGS